ncbi:hypothetical protein PybrP1_012168 [[Pythium] brassicae (nom. inval.)]|nr:hypothetical protein PybrP1_012168 [[Pythium] brassicae (nom. inval.)]
MRTRRSSVPVSSSRRNVLEAGGRPKSDDAPGGPTGVSPNVGAGTQPEIALKQHSKTAPPQSSGAVSLKASTRQSSLFASQAKKQEQSEQSEVIAALQQNGVTLSALNEREKARSAQLTEQVVELVEELRRAKEALEEERIKNEKITALRKHKLTGDYEASYLPGIHATSAAAAAAVQQQAQLEISYQRRILSLENRSKDLIENNKKLLGKIQQLEKTEADAGAEIDALRKENSRLATQVDSLSSTVASQSSLIIGLRTTVQRLTQEEQNVSSLVKKFDRCQIDLEAVKTREKLLRDEHEKLKLVMSKEKEMFMGKILALQQQLQLTEQAGAATEAFAGQIRRLEAEKRELQTRVAAVSDTCEQVEARMHAQEEMTNRFMQEKLDAECARDQREAELAAKYQELATQQARIEELSARVQEQDVLSLQRQRDSELAQQTRDREIDALMLRTVDQERALDELKSALDKRGAEALALRSDIQRFQQLSQDETVQALQLARLKAANHEALALLEDEKRELQERVDALQRQSERDASRVDELKAALEAKLLASETRVRDLLEENRALYEKTIEQQPPPPVAAQVEGESVVAEAATPASPVDPAERARLEAEMAQLQQDYAELKESFFGVESEYKKLVTRKYKTESFQSQVRLLQNENSELALKLAQVCADLTKERADLNSRTLENLELRTRVVDLSAIELLRRTQESLEKTVSALVEAEAASESSFTCLQCMQLFVEPMTLAPCGHTYCASCVATFGDVDDPASLKCKDCMAAETRGARTTSAFDPPDAVYPNQALADLTARFVFRQQSLSSLATMCLSLRNSFANRSASTTS